MSVDHLEEISLLSPLRRTCGLLTGSLLWLSAGLFLGCTPSHGSLTDTLTTTTEGTSSTISGTSGETTNPSTSTSGEDSTGSNGTSGETTNPSTSGGDSTSGSSDTSSTTDDATTSTTSMTSDDTLTDSSSSSETDTGTTGDLEDGACRSDADCDEGAEEFCYAPDEVNCGVCEEAMVSCSDDDPCEPPFYCDAVVLDCPCNEPVSYACRPACENDDECGPDRICAGEMCIFLSCNDGFVCPETHDCLEDGGEGNDCHRRLCVIDSDCAGDSQVCVEGACFLDFGECELPAP